MIIIIIIICIYIYIYRDKKNSLGRLPDDPRRRGPTSAAEGIYIYIYIYDV